MRHLKPCYCLTPHSKTLTLKKKEISERFTPAFSVPVLFPQATNMSWFFHIFFLCFLCLTGANQEAVELLNLYEANPNVLRPLSHTGFPVAISFSEADLNEVSSSVLMAESWIRTHVLTNYPATNITTIVVGDTVLCYKNKEDKFGLVLPCIKNIYYSLTRWGLEKEIKLSASLSPECFKDHPLMYEIVKPLLNFLQHTNSSYSVKPLLNVSPLSKPIRKLGFFKLITNKVTLLNATKDKPISRKLSLLYSAPSTIARNPFPPLADISAPPMSFSFPPEFPPESSSPTVLPANPPEDFTLPPCNPPETGEMKELWCVAKPSVPVATLQVAMDYACGEGGADCEDIRPRGRCYSPDTIVAHASYAFNSYWQKNKRNGGTCSFGGTAMVVNSDPSFLHCRFILS